MDINFLSPFDTVLTPDKDPTLCQVLGCTNHRSNADYGRLRKVCEKHHHQRFNMDYAGTIKKVRSLRRQVTEDLAELERTLKQQGIAEALAKLGELRKKY